MATKARESAEWTAEDLESLWDERFPGCEPEVDALRSANPYHWVQAELAPGLDEGAKLEHVLNLAEQAVWSGEPVVVIRWEPSLERDEPTRGKARPWRVVAQAEGGFVRLVFELGTWRRSGFTRLWKKLAQGQVSSILVLSRTRRIALHVDLERVDAFVDTTSDGTTLATAWKRVPPRGS